MSNELVNQDTGEITTTISTDSLINIANKAEERIEAVRKIKGLSLRVTNHQDWVDQAGKPYLQTSGGEKIARLFGISWTVEEPRTQQDGDDGHYLITYKGIFSLGNASIECIGTRSSKDGFFKKYEEGSYVDGKYVRGKELPSSAIDIGDVVKSAYTNLIGNGITRLLGIRNLTYDDLAESGIDVSQITKVEYKTKVKTPQSKSMNIEFVKVVTSISNVTQFECRDKSIKYTVHGEGKATYSTFDVRIATLAKSFIPSDSNEEPIKVQIKHKPNVYKTIVSIDTIDIDKNVNTDIAADLEKAADWAAKEAGL